jgi:hypothetical protein
LAQCDDCYAACWNQTSVSDAWPHIHEKCKACGCEIEDEYRDYDISKDEGHWFMFDKLEVEDRKEVAR